MTKWKEKGKRTDKTTDTPPSRPATQWRLTILGYYNMFVSVVALHTLSTDPGTQCLLQVRHWRGRWEGDNAPVRSEIRVTGEKIICSENRNAQVNCVSMKDLVMMDKLLDLDLRAPEVLVAPVLPHIFTQYNMISVCHRVFFRQADVTSHVPLQHLSRCVRSIIDNLTVQVFTVFLLAPKWRPCGSGFLVWRHLYAPSLRSTSEKKVEQPASFWHSGTNPLLPRLLFTPHTSLLFFAPPFRSSFVVALPSSLLFSSPTMVSCHLVLLMFSTCTSFR